MYVQVVLSGLLAQALSAISLVVLLANPAEAKEPFPLPETVLVPAGEFVSGSLREEREIAYGLDEAAYGHSITRTQRWYEFEYDQQTRTLPRFEIMTTPVTRCDYARFLRDTGHGVPQIDEAAWNDQRLKHSFISTKKFQWQLGEENNQNRCEHPVVLVTHKDAVSYAQWLSTKTGQIWRLPDEFEWEKAARGVDANLFPWGNEYDASKLNSHDNGPFDTLPVGSFTDGASPFGLLDGAGQIFEWTATGDDKAMRFVVKGGSWDDKGCGVCRAAARHYRPENLKHILVGFRLVTD